MNKLLLSTLSAGVLAMAASSMAQPMNGPDNHDQNKAAHQANRAAPKSGNAGRQAAQAQHGAANVERRANQQPNRMEQNMRSRTATAGARQATAQANRATTQAHRATTQAQNARDRANTAAQRSNTVTRQNNRAVTRPAARVQTRDLNRYRANVQATRRYHYTRAYVRPSGWYNRRWTYGQTFPRGWYGQQYWITNFLAYGLFAPPYGYEWVRYGDDALLIDTNTGMIVRVEYGLFY